MTLVQQAAIMMEKLLVKSQQIVVDLLIRFDSGAVDLTKNLPVVGSRGGEVYYQWCTIEDKSSCLSGAFFLG